MSQDETTPIILVADDDPMIRVTARTILEKLGMRVEEADDGPTTLDALDDHYPWLVLLDVMMPGMDGFEVCRRLRASKNHSRIPVMMLTGLDDMDSIGSAYESGATDFCPKPVNWTILGERVRYMLRAAHDSGRMQLYERMLEDAGLAYWESPAGAETGMVFSRRSRDLLRLPWKPGTCPEHEFMKRVLSSDRAELIAARTQARELGRAYNVQYRFYDRFDDPPFVIERGEMIRDDRSRKLKLIATCQDVTARRKSEERIERLANSDALTGLPNRRLLDDRFQQALYRARREEEPLACLFLDLDRFKQVNDTLGHSAGDELLAEAAKRLIGCVRDVDTVARFSEETQPTVARFGGDEFVILLESMRSEDDAELVARRIQELFAFPFTIGDYDDLRVTPSVGISLSPRDGTDSETLLKHADAAMYEAKERGGKDFSFFSQEIDDKAQRRLSVEQALHRALDNNEFALHYQPLFSAGDGDLTGVEALLRWNGPDHGVVSPAEFLPIAEDSTLILAIGDWVLQQACADWQALFDAGAPPLRVAVNISALQLRRGDLVARIRSVLRGTGFPAQMLELELTESLLIGDAFHVHDAVGKLKELGVSIALDDFGTGYSSLSILKQFPIDRIKIDRSFVKNLTVHPENASMVTAIISMGAGLNMQVTAEGVELPEQLSFLSERACDEVQGYLLGRPQPLDKLVAQLFGTSVSLPLAS